MLNKCGQPDSEIGCSRLSARAAYPSVAQLVEHSVHTRDVVGSSPTRGTRSASHTRWYWIAKGKFSRVVRTACDKIFLALPTANAVFISFHVRSWGLRPKKYSPPCILRSREEADLATLIRWRTVVRIHPPQPLRSGQAAKSPAS